MGPKGPLTCASGSHPFPLVPVLSPPIVAPMWPHIGLAGGWIHGRERCHLYALRPAIVPGGSIHEHSFSNIRESEVPEKLGIPEVPGKLDSESLVEVTTSRSSRRTMVVV